MSFLSTNAQAEKKTALKLLNKYADSYNAIIQENNFLKSEIMDLKANIKINKEIIQGFFSDKNFKEKINTYLKQYKQENENLYNQKDKLIKTIQNLTSKLSYNEQIFNETISQARDESEKLNRGINKDFHIETKRIKAHMSLINSQIEYEEGLKSFKKRINSIQDESILKKTPQEKYNLYIEKLRRDEEKRKKEAEAKLEKTAS